jgi:NAD(P)-dependent dehydrogenase (short-subunit alcohol dehydrogenase family)
MLDKRIAVITGASKGIGSAVARGLAADGYHCCLIARNSRLLDEQAAQITASGGTASCHPTDLSQTSNISLLCEELQREFGRCDVLLNNAGIWTPGLFEASVDVWSKLIATNLTAPLYLMKLLHPLLRRGERSCVFNLCSIGAREGSSRTGAYGSTKRALLSLSESAFKIFAKDGIRVVALCPSWTATEMAEQAGCPYDSSDMIQPSDILETMRWVSKLSPAAAIREVFIDCYKDVR